MSQSDRFLGAPEHWTLEELVLSGRAVMFECVHCGHTEILDVPALARKHGPQTRVSYFKRNMACARCGRTGIDQA